MPRPTRTTPITRTIAVLHGLDGWTIAHVDALAPLLGQTPEPDHCASLAQILQDAEAETMREQREDRHVVATKRELLTKTRRYLQSLDATLRLTATPDAFDAARAAMLQTMPSRIRSTRQLRRALVHAVEGIKAHTSALGSHAQARLDQATSLLDALTRVEADEAREPVETRSAFVARDQARDAAIDHIERLTLAARAVSFEDATALEELALIFDAHNPARSGTRTEPNGEPEDLDDDLDGGPEDTPDAS